MINVGFIVIVIVGVGLLYVEYSLSKLFFVVGGYYLFLDNEWFIWFIVGGNVCFFGGVGFIEGVCNVCVCGCASCVVVMTICYKWNILV